MTGFRVKPGMTKEGFNLKFKGLNRIVSTKKLQETMHEVR